MAGIDKICGTEKQLIEFRKWLKENKPEYLDMVNDPENEFYFTYNDREIKINSFKMEGTHIKKKDGFYTIKWIISLKGDGNGS